MLGMTICIVRKGNCPVSALERFGPTDTEDDGLRVTRVNKSAGALRIAIATWTDHKWFSRLSTSSKNKD